MTTSAGPWPYTPELLGPELDRYLADAAPSGVQQLATRCPAWTVREVTVHLLCTFSRFGQLLSRGRAGDFSVPFTVDELAARNQQAVRGYRGADPARELRDAVSQFSSALGAGDELMPHQRGPVPVALQVLFGLNELAIHHDDIAAAADRHYVPPPETLVALQILWRQHNNTHVTGWSSILRAAGRTPH